MGLRPREIYELTPREWYNYSKGIENKNREEWERARYMTYHIIMYNGMMTKQPKITELLPLPWDDKTETKITKKDIQKIRKLTAHW